LVRELANDAALRGKVIPLAFHVDYWDRLGWRDPFSAPDWTRRQQFYVRALSLNSAYTPQMVVNGSRQFVGSNAHALDAALAEESRLPPFGSVHVSVARGTGALQATVRATVTSAKPTDVMLVVYENGISTAVKAGENSGLTIENEAIVRRLIRVGSGSVETTVTIPLDKSWSAPHLGVVAFLQDHKTLAIRGAAVAPASSPAG
jgi:hypothetical protein